MWRRLANKVIEGGFALELLANFQVPLHKTTIVDGAGVPSEAEAIVGLVRWV
jgi:hypothetical protein